MPFQSESQRRFMWLKHPDIAKRWSKEFPGQKKLPYHVKKAKVAKHIANQHSAIMNGLRKYGNPV